MKALTKWIMVLISVLFLGGSAWGYNAQMHVRNADGGRGDLVLFKSYIALEGGWATKFSITNTAKASVVAKVIVRSSLNSLSFWTFLSTFRLMMCGPEKSMLMQKASQDFTARTAAAGTRKMVGQVLPTR
jgi:hypothetical protein